VAFPYIELTIDVNVLSTMEMDLHMGLLTFPASPLKGHSVPLKIKTSTETGEGYILLDDVHLTASCSRVHFVKTGTKSGHADR
jgi:hypothetical protein